MLQRLKDLLVGFKRNLLSWCCDMAWNPRIKITWEPWIIVLLYYYRWTVSKIFEKIMTPQNLGKMMKPFFVWICFKCQWQTNPPPTNVHLGLKPKMVLFLDGIVPGSRLLRLCSGPYVAYDYDDTMGDLWWVYLWWSILVTREWWTELQCSSSKSWRQSWTSVAMGGRTCGTTLCFFCC